MSYDRAVALAKDKYRKPHDIPVNYGTAGFRTKSDGMDFIMFRMGLLASLRSQSTKAAVGVMITASHNPVEDNGVKLIEPKGEMLIEEWETHATTLANSTEEGIASVLQNIVDNYNIDTGQRPLVFVGRDTRPSSERLQEAVESGVKALDGKVTDFGVVSTPVLHYVVTCHNDGGEYGTPTVDGYLTKISSAFNSLRSEIAINGNYNPQILFDGSNGVGALMMNKFLPHLKNNLQVECFNTGDGELNHLCGADFVKTNQRWPTGVRLVTEVRCASVDGDADRLMYSYMDDRGLFHLLDGDKIATLIAGFLKTLSEEAGLDLKLGLVQTAYANGASTDYISNQLGVPVACAKTGVKHLHRMALDFDIGVYFEANGHGTVIFSNSAKKAIQEAKDQSKPSAKTLYTVMNLINETVGDAISDLLLVESVLLAKGWSAGDWNNSYTDLPNTLLKVTVSDRTAVTTTDAERVCVLPEGLQDTIEHLTKKYQKGRAFVRPSGTEDVVRVYAETSERRTTDLLGYEVASAVYKLAGGVGDKPVCASHL